MNNKFVDELKESIWDRLSDEDDVNSIEVQEVVKNNNTTHTGLVFKGDSDIAPIIYVDNAYEEYQGGRTIDGIADDIVKTYHNSIYHGPTSAEDFIDYEKVKDKLIVCAMNEEANAEMLKDIPHESVLDVAIIARIEVTSDENGIGTVKVNDELLEAYGITKEELFEQAWANMKAMHPMECKDMIDVIQGIDPNIPDEVKEMMDEHRGEMFVVQTDNKLHGAPYGFDKESLNSVCEQIESQNIYICPSSVNEVIVIPESKVDDPGRLIGIVGQVNDESVPSDEVLSNNAYFYDSQTEEISIVDTQTETMDIKM